MIAVRATFAGFPAVDELGVFGLQVWVEAGGDEGRHVERLADVGATAANEGAAGPASGLSGDRRKAGEAWRPGRPRGCRARAFRSASAKAVMLRDAGNASQDGEAFGEVGVGLDDVAHARRLRPPTICRSIWSRRWAFWRFSSDRMRTLARFLAAVRSLTRASRARWSSLSSSTISLTAGRVGNGATLPSAPAWPHPVDPFWRACRWLRRTGAPGED